MKKILYILICTILCISLTACLRGDQSETVKDAPSEEKNETISDKNDGNKGESSDKKPGGEESKQEETTAAPLLEYPPATADSIKVSYPIDAPDATVTGLPSLPSMDFNVIDPNNTRGLSIERVPFSYGVASGGEPHHITVSNQQIFDSYGTNALAWDNKSEEKVLYLTFDCGYKFEDLTSRILDTLKEKDVPAAFFCTMDYLDDEPEVINRMIEEGHIVGNHSTTHPDCTTISREEFAYELLGVHNYMRVNFGYTPKYFRFPTGAFSENAVDLADSVGYRSVFWSVAYADWDPYSQQGTETAYNQVTSRLHPGAVILLHSTSPDNAAILGRVIDYARSCGYEFKSLDYYAYWN